MARHYAFPGFVVASNGDYIAAYRDGPRHDAATSTTLADRGVIRTKVSTDQGMTWGASSIAQDDGEDDSRDVCLTRLASGNIIMSFFVHRLISVQPYVSISTDNGATWGPRIYVPNSFGGTSEVCSGPVVELPNGDLLLALYGQLAEGDANRSVIVVRSTDGGATWGSDILIADGPTAGENYTEPNIVRLNNGNLHCYIRAANTWRSVSTDDGATWSALENIASPTGRPTALVMSDDVLLLPLRSGGLELWASEDSGESWRTPIVVESGFYVYAQMQQVANRKAGLVYAMENTADDTEADLYYREVTY